MRFGEMATARVPKDRACGRERSRRAPRLPLRYLGILLIGWLSTAHAQVGVFKWAEDLFSKKIEYRVRVVDEAQHPIAYPTLWVTWVTDEYPNLSAADMERWLGNFSLDYDLISSGRPNSHSLVRFADANGEYRGIWEKNDFGKNAEMIVIFGVIKRGYRAQATMQRMPVGSSQEVVVQLTREPTEVFDARLEELDRARGEANRTMANWNGAEQAAHLDGLANRLSALAVNFEREGKLNEAAVLYYGLAALPSIDRMKGPDGIERILGYTRGYDKNSPTRRSYMEKALELGSSIPLLGCQQVRADLNARKASFLYHQSPELRSIRLQAIEKLERIMAPAPQRCLLADMLLLSDLYSHTGQPDRACVTLRKAYRIDPQYYPKESWQGRLESLEDTATGKGYASIPGLEVFPDFTCEMPLEQ